MPSDEFNQAAAAVRTLTTKPSDSDMLKLYGLYKQVTVGACNIAEPPSSNVEGRAKWNAWNANKGKATDKAEKEYVALVNQLKA
ncbi:acyl-CoA-binding protein homolog [Apostichopus japonicus]|uniref:acyl-CoA-binding protein homolog n=1 Tax=Stichopus japonicus TaxID=307972 RepID=UPI003AB848AA